MSGTFTKLSLLKRKNSLNSLSIGYSHYQFDLEDDSAERVSEAIRSTEQYKSIQLSDVPLDKLKAIVKNCGREAEYFKLSINGYDYGALKTASDLIEILNLMPKLEKFDLALPNYNVIANIDDVRVERSLSSLKSLSIEIEFSAEIFRFFNKILPENSLQEFSFVYEGSMKEIDEINFRDFLSKQKFIKNFVTDHEIGLKLIAKHELEELNVTSLFRYKNIDREIAELLKLQPKLKSLSVKLESLENVINEICKLSQLETLNLKARICRKEDFEKLRNIKTLKEFSIEGRPTPFEIFLHQKHKNLQKLTLQCGFYQKIDLTSEMLENLPNLIYLSLINPTLKFNVFAKFLPKLEEIHLQFGDGNFEFCELDTGIVSKSLKRVHIHIQWLESLDEILEVLEICPNLEELKLTSPYKKYAEINASNFFKERFFESLNEIKSLKSLTLETIKIKNFTNFYPQISEELIKLSRKLNYISIEFSNWFDEDDEEYFSYQPLKEMLKDDFEVEHEVVYIDD